MSTHRIETAIDIAAPAERVWEILTDFPAYPEWNPFIRSIQGTPAEGSRLIARIEPSGARGMTFRPTVLTAVPGRELAWLGRLVLPGIFDGEHRFTIEPLDGGKIRFHHREEFRGFLVSLLRASLDRDTKRGFEEMNQALKTRAEATSHAR